MKQWVLVVVACIACGRTEPVRFPPEPPAPVCALTIEPRALDFGAVSPGQESLRRVVLRDEGEGPCTVNAVLAATNDPTFTIADGPPFPVALSPGQVVTLTLRFTGEAVPPSERRGVLTLTSDDPLEPSVEVDLSARVTFCLLTARPDPVDFGNVALNTTAQGQVTLTNEGVVACEVTDLALEAGSDPLFSMPGAPTGLTISPGAAAAVRLAFAATDSAPPHLRQGHLVFRSNDARGPRGRVALSAYINTICTEAGQFIYTVDNDGRFSRFNPRTLDYVDIAPLRCPTAASPFSMNVDQNAIAWVIFSDANLYRVDTADGSCTATSYQPNQAGFSTYGMGSTFDSSTGTDTLYLATLDVLGPGGGSQLGTLSFPSLTVTPVGPMTLSNPELAGTGDGQLWAFTPPNSGAIPVLARVDPKTAATLERYELPNVTSLGGWAIKFFGGAFYLFIGADIWRVDRTSLDPRHLEPTTPPVRVLSSPGRDIVGAGVSTCAPTQ